MPANPATSHRITIPALLLLDGSGSGAGGQEGSAARSPPLPLERSPLQSSMSASVLGSGFDGRNPELKARAGPITVSFLSCWPEGAFVAGVGSRYSAVDRKGWMDAQALSRAIHEV